MAEALIYVTDDTNPDTFYQDGDVLGVWTDLNIETNAIQRICYEHKPPFDSNGLLPDGLTRNWFEKNFRYKFERISKTEVRQTEIDTGITKVLSSTPDSDGHHMHVELFIARRMQHDGRMMFGTPGSEIWYSKSKTASTTINAEMWDMVETDTAERRTDWHNRHVALGLEFASCIAIGYDAGLTDEIGLRLIAHEIDYDEYQPEYSSDRSTDARLGDNLVRKRRCNFDWRAGTSVNQVDAVKRHVKVDLRESQEISNIDIETKPRTHVWSVRDHLEPDIKALP